jgi:hypothetical protein
MSRKGDARKPTEDSPTGTRVSNRNAKESGMTAIHARQRGVRWRMLAAGLQTIREMIGIGDGNDWVKLTRRAV